LVPDRIAHGCGCLFMTRRFPRLKASRATPMLARQQALALADLERWPLPDLTSEQFAPTGPSKISLSELAALRVALDGAAREAGYPASEDEARRQFDRKATRLLGERELPEDEMLRPDTWGWIAIHLVPHLVRWRWQNEAGNVTPARYCGIVQRNAIGRLWYRAYVLDEGPEHADRWALADALTEDAAMNLLERTTLASDRRLSRSIMRHWASATGGTGLEGRLREGLIRVRIEAVLRDLAVLDDKDLDAVVAAALAMSPAEVK
jgi:hypothetical protein